MFGAQIRRTNRQASGRPGVSAILFVAWIVACGAKTPGGAVGDSESSTGPSGALSSSTSASATTPDPATVTGSSSTGATSSSGGGTTIGPQGCDFESRDCPPGTECVDLNWEAPPGPACAPTCDLRVDDCPEGQKCLAYGPSWQYAHCTPVAPNPAGLHEPCDWIGPVEDHSDTCAPGLICWFQQWQGADDPDRDFATGVCLPQCYWYTGECPEGYLCLGPTMYTDLGVCTPVCDPLEPGCPSGSGCEWFPWDAGFGEGGEFVCDGTVEAQGYGSSCAGEWNCLDGLVCVGAASVPGCASEACCSSYCDVNAPNVCPDSPLQECVALSALWGNIPNPPGPQFAHIGICVVP